MLSLMHMTNGIWEWVLAPGFLIWFGFWLNDLLASYEANKLKKEQSRFYDWEKESN